MEQIQQPSLLYKLASQGFRAASEKFYKDGVELEKGAIITRKRIDQNRELYEKWSEFFINYPDIFLDTIKRKDIQFNLFFYQRLLLRLTMRYGRLLVIAPRAFSKSFISILALYLMCIFRPGIKLFICAPGKAQSAKIAREKIYEIWDLFPLLKKEIIGEGNFGGDYVKNLAYLIVILKNKSLLIAGNSLTRQSAANKIVQRLSERSKFK